MMCEERQKLEYERVIDGGVCRLSQSARTALDYACHSIAKDNRLRNGKTALYWHLVGIVASHIEDTDAATNLSGNAPKDRDGNDD
jgi:hypothetical protein